MPNPGYLLRPDMFVDVEFHIELPEAVTVPVDAIVDSGLRKTVFVARGNGIFEPRPVETGWRFGDRVEVLGGLGPGDQCAVAGLFLLDSESRMKAAAAGENLEWTKLYQDFASIAKTEGLGEAYEAFSQVAKVEKFQCMETVLPGGTIPTLMT
jgi:hypothetical protein